MSPKATRFLASILAIATVISSITALAFYSRWKAARDLERGDNGRAAIQNRLWDSDKRVHDLERTIASLRGPAAPADENAAQTPAETGDSRGNRRAAFGQFRQSPEVQRLVMAQQKAALDTSYGKLFKTLNLPPGQLDKLKELLVERQSSTRDAMGAARQEGMDPRDSATRAKLAEVVAAANGEVDGQIKELLGDNYPAYSQYVQTAPQRASVDQLAQRLSYTNDPLRPGQEEQLVAALAGASTAPVVQAGRFAGGPFNGGGGPFGAGGPGGGGDGAIAVQLTPEAIQKASGVLSPTQVAALTELYQEQQAQQTVTQMVGSQLDTLGDPNLGRRNRPRNNPTAAQPAPGSGG